jgi:hypothetical protein
MTNKKQGAIALAAVVATILTLAAVTPGQAAQTVQDRGTRVTQPTGTTVVAWEAGALRSGR